MLVARLGTLAALALALLLLLPTIAGARSGPLQPKIIRGTPATTGEFPWQVGLVQAGQPAGRGQFCGGTLVTPQVVITAAHCVVGAGPDDIQVITGVISLTDPRTDVGGTHRQDVERIAVHPYADADDDDPYASPRRDVAVLWLSTDAAAGAAAIPIGTDTDLAASPFHISGWGATLDGYPNTLQWATVDRVSDDACDSVMGEGFSDTDMLCASGGTAPNLIDTCQGDSGGPLAANVADRTSASGVKLVGVTSFGIGCAEPPYPGIYTRITAPLLRDWAEAARTAATPGDGPPEQPYHQAGGAVPVIDGAAVTEAQVGDTLECYQSISLAWGGEPDQIEYLIRRDDGAAGYTTVSTSPVYTFSPGDAEQDFVCELRARRAGAGGYGAVRSTPVTVAALEQEPPPTVTVTVPGPTVTVPGPPVPVPVPAPYPVPVPGPVVTVPVPVPTQQPRVEDDTAPRVRRVRRSCTRKRVCRFTVTVSDPAPSAGVKQVTATLAQTVTRRCTKRGRRTTCSTSTHFVDLRGTAKGRTVKVTTKRLRKGTYTLTLRAVDAAGNVQERPYRTRFRLR